MTRAIAKLLILLAVLVMPLGMTPAVAVPLGSHATMPVGHCPEPMPGHEKKAGLAECTMACSVALPASEIGQSERPMVVCAPDLPDFVQELRGLHPDTATPPPKRS